MTRVLIAVVIALLPIALTGCIFNHDDNELPAQVRNWVGHTEDQGEDLADVIGQSDDLRVAPPPEQRSRLQELNKRGYEIGEQVDDWVSDMTEEVDLEEEGEQLSCFIFTKEINGELPDGPSELGNAIFQFLSDRFQDHLGLSEIEHDAKEALAWIGQAEDEGEETVEVALSSACYELAE